MKKIIVFTLIVIISQCPSFSLAQKVVVLTEEWAPFNYTVDGKVVGMSTDLVVAALNKAGLEYELNVYPWKRAYKSALETTNTLLYTTSRTEKREKLFKWVGPLYQRQIILYKLKSRKDIVVSDIESLKDYKLGILLGGSVEEYLQAQGFKRKKHYEAVSKESQNIPKLFAERVDLIPGSDISMAFRMKDSPYNFGDLEKAFVLIDQGGYYLALNVNTPDNIITLLQSKLDDLVADGMREKITRKYLGYSFEN